MGRQVGRSTAQKRDVYSLRCNHTVQNRALLIIAALAGLLVATVPLWAVVIGAVLDRQRPSFSVIGGLGLGLTGVTLLIGPGNIAGGDSKTLLGIIVILAACFSWALGTHYSRRATQPDSQNMATALNMLAGGFLLVVFSGINGEYAGFDVGAVTLKSGLQSPIWSCLDRSSASVPICGW